MSYTWSYMLVLCATSSFIGTSSHDLMFDHACPNARTCMLVIWMTFIFSFMIVRLSSGISSLLWVIIPFSILIHNNLSYMSWMVILVLNTIVYHSSMFLTYQMHDMHVLMHDHIMNMKTTRYTCHGHVCPWNTMHLFLEGYFSTSLAHFPYYHIST